MKGRGLSARKEVRESRWGNVASRKRLRRAGFTLNEIQCMRVVSVGN